jgi:potassium efflux system protein
LDYFSKGLIVDVRHFSHKIKAGVMKQLPRFVSTAVLAVAATLFAGPLFAQVQETPAGGQAGSAGGGAMPDLKIADVEAGLEAIEADTGIEDAVKDLLRPKYKQAIDVLKEAADFSAKAAEYRELVSTGPERAEEFRDQLKALPSADSAAEVIAAGNPEDLQRDVDSRGAALKALGDELSKITSELTRAEGRPVAISGRLPEVQSELSEIGKELESPQLAADATSPGVVADHILLQARHSALLAEFEMLKQEQASQAVREELLKAQKELLTRQVENATAALDALKGLLDKQLASEAKQISLLAERAAQALPQGDAAASTLAAEVQALATEFEEVVENLKNVTAARKDSAARFTGVTDEYESIREQLDLGSGGGAMAQVLLELKRRIRSAPANRLIDSQPTLEQTRLASLQVKQKLRGQPDIEKQFADRSSDAVAQLVTTRLRALRNLETQYGNLIQGLAEFEGDKRQYLVKAEKIEGYIAEQLVWMRSSPAIGTETITDIPSGLRWAFGRDRWLELGGAVRWVANGMPVHCVGVVVIVTVLLVTRRRMVAALEKTGVAIRRISTDRYAHTAQAVVWTFLLAAPIPLLIGFAGWALEQIPNPSLWLQDMAFNFRIAAWVVFGAAMLSAICRPGGLGDAHFGRSKERLARFRRAIHWFVVVYVPALLLTVSYNLYGDGADYFDSVGRIIFMLAHAWTAIVLWQLFRGPGGVLDTLTGEHPTHFVTRWRYLWFPLMLACPISLIVLAGLGYLITAIELSLGLLTILALIAGGDVLYCLVLRWFMIKQRKFALAEALERRRAQREAAASQEEEEPSGEIVTVDPEDEEELDLESVSEQTRALLRLVFGLGVAVAVLVFWSKTFPLIAIFEEIRIPLTEGLTLLGLTQAVLILVVTYIAVRNLPGLLELAVLRAKTIEAGTRNAITTLCQYAVTAIGLVVLFTVLHVDWARFGWIAAALSVGLGFGLQEVVANFVCGLILLFERPIRVGDVVTVEGMTGTVTRIHLRATTITNWDRQEFVVPNKTLITNTLLNWTLSAPLNRVAITVGVAYGSDTEEARRIMLDVAADHERVLDDPAPMASFEQFADSSLNLVLRAYLPDLENRLGTITELHTEINRRFASAGIEIAFPQQDLHFRSGWEGTRPAASDGAEDGKKDAAPERARASSASEDTT